MDTKDRKDTAQKNHNMRSVGKTELQVSPLCLGGNVFGWTADEADS